MTRSLFVIENGRGEFWMPRRERDAELEHYGANSHASDPTAGIVEYVPRVRCDGCKHARSPEIAADGSICMVPFAGYPIALCDGIGMCSGQWHPREWFCADHEAKEET